MLYPPICSTIGLKARGIPYSTASTRRAMENTAKSVEGTDALCLGHGLFQVTNNNLIFNVIFVSEFTDCLTLEMSDYR